MEGPVSTDNVMQLPKSGSLQVDRRFDEKAATTLLTNRYNTYINPKIIIKKKKSGN